MKILSLLKGKKRRPDLNYMFCQNSSKLKMSKLTFTLIHLNINYNLNTNIYMYSNLNEKLYNVICSLMYM